MHVKEERRATFDIKDSSSSSLQQAERSRMKGRPFTASGPCKFLISNLPRSLKEPKAAVRWLLGLWQNILVHHAKLSGTILKTALLRESFIQLLHDQRIFFQLASSSDHLQYRKHSATMLQ